MNKLSELDKAGKISLLESIKRGEINPNDITQKTMIVSNGKEAFLGLMIAGSQINNNELPIIFIGEAKEQLEKFMEDIEARRADVMPGAF